MKKIYSVFIQILKILALLSCFILTNCEYKNIKSNIAKIIDKLPDNEFFSVNSSNAQSSYTDGYSIERGKLRITRHGITWIINRKNGTPYTEEEYNEAFGEFANGDYWVVGPVYIVKILPKSINKSGRIINGSMINPSTAISNQGYDSCIEWPLTYQPALNVAYGISESKPLELSGGKSLISTISTPTPDYYEDTRLTDAAVLTILTDPPADRAGSFRPPYIGTDKTIKYTTSQLNFTLLMSETPPADFTIETLNTYSGYLERVWLDHIPTTLGLRIHPYNNMPPYGAHFTRRMGYAALALHLNFTNDQKKMLLIRLVQLGIDNYSLIQDQKNNGSSRLGREPDGGHQCGRKWPILFAGLILNDTEMKNIGQKSGDYLYQNGYGPGNRPPDLIQFQEDDQIFHVTQDDVDRTHSAAFNTAGLPYESADIGLPEWGINHSVCPVTTIDYSDNKKWSAPYRSIVSFAVTPFVFAARMTPGAKTLWNHDALFDYADRWIAVYSVKTSTPSWRSIVESMLAPYTSVEGTIWGEKCERDWRFFDEFMWDNYRHKY